MGRFGSEPQSEPEPDRTEPEIWVRVWDSTRTGPSVPFAVWQTPEPLRTGSEWVRT
jgi:hypothetical protein